MEKQAKEELEMLESQYPHNFEYLKLELKSFIFQHQSQQLPENTNFLSSIADTQESTSLNQRKRKSTDVDSDSSEHGCYKTENYSDRMMKNKRKDRVDVLLERAEACLKKIRHFKNSLLSDS